MLHETQVERSDMDAYQEDVQATHADAQKPSHGGRASVRGAKHKARLPD